MHFLRDLSRDSRYALRTLRREPAFAAGVILTFALAIGANAAMFGLVERLMLAAPPGIRDAERVVRVQMRFTFEDGRTSEMTTTSYPAYGVIKELKNAFAGVTAVRSDTVTIGRGADLAEVAVVQATGDYFATLGAKPALGRFFGPDDDLLPNGNDVVVLSHAFWRRHFGGESSALGSQLIVDGQLLTIVGVAPPGFNGVELSSTDLFVPLTTAMRKQGAGWSSNSQIRFVTIIARLGDGVVPAGAGEMVASTLRASGAESLSERLDAVGLVSLLPGRSARQSPQARIALLLSGVSLIVLLIATANVGTLLLLRAARRRRDTAVRIALGADRRRLLRQSLVESILLALIGGAVGLLLSAWLADIVRLTLLPNVAPGERVADTWVLMATLIASIGAGFLAGLSPLAQLGRRNLSVDLQAGGGNASSARFLFQHVLLGVQVALCAILLVGAGLFVRSLDRVRSQDLGFSTAKLLHVTLDFREAVRGRERDGLHEEAVKRTAAIPGVTGATVVQGMPFSSHHIPPIHIPGLAEPPNAGGQIPILYGATSAYLDMMGLVAREGRLFTEADREGSPLVVIVNETMARSVWPTESAIGKCVRAGHGPTLVDDPMAAAALLPCRTVVGVVRDSRARSLRVEGHEAKLMQYYIPFGQLPKPPFPDVPDVHAILVRVSGDPERLAPSVQRIIQSTSAVPVYAKVRPYQQLLDPQLRSWRLGATLFSAFGSLALGIAAVGLFAVVSYVVTQRTKEIGVRMALGGSGMRVARLIVGDAMRMAGAGVAVGLVIALGAAPLVQSMLFQTSAREWTIVLAAALVLVGITIGAAALPAGRASRGSPMSVLRADQESARRGASA
jgi:putative ABC transport system permease protein